MFICHLLELMPELILFSRFWLSTDIIRIEHLWFRDVVENLIGLLKSDVVADGFFGYNHFAWRVYIVSQ